MAFALLLTVLVGISIVAQGSVNAQLLKSSNLWLLLTIGNIFCTVTTLVVYLASRARGSLWGELRHLPPTVLVPSICGLVITAGMPVAIGRLGVFTAVIVVIAVQIVTGLAWDRFAGGVPVSMVRLLGAALVFGGSLLVLRG
jgi:uncharacterized membrane protein YdcZ (DUF606 family)